MRLTRTNPFAACLIAALLLAVSVTFAQPGVLGQRVSVSCRNQPIAGVLADLQSRYRIPFAYFGELAALQRPVSLELRDQPLRVVLDTLLARTPVMYQSVGEQIVLKAAAAQAVYASVSGQVTDGATGLPLPFAAIRLQRAALGTVANEDGRFTFHFPEGHSTDTLTVSRLGYRNYAAPVARVLESGQSIFALSPDTLLLEAVTVQATPLTAAGLVDSAVANIERNYPMEPYNLSLFYRETLREGDTYVSLAEAAALLYDDRGYREPRGRFADEKVKILKARGIRYQPDTGPNRWVNHLSAALEHNAVKYRESYLKNRRHAQYRRLPDEVWNGKPVFVVTAANPRYQVTIWIGAERYAIVRYVLESQPTTTFISTTERKDSDSTFYAATQNTVINEFREQDGKWYPQYLQWSYAFRRFDKKTGRPIPSSGQHRRLDLLVNEVNTDSVRAVSKAEAMNGRMPVGYLDRDYDPQFWKTYNLLVPLDAQISRDLEKKGNLDEQFGQDLPPEARKRLRKTNRKNE